VAAAIRRLADGEVGMVMAADLPRPARDPIVDLRVRTLSGREREILGLLANGWSNRRIAQECFVSLNTVRTHVQNVLIKSGSTPSWRRSPSPWSTAWWPAAAAASRPSCWSGRRLGVGRVGFTDSIP
jgi:DNA-binding CsgD family transcriptional regulator